MLDLATRKPNCGAVIGEITRKGKYSVNGILLPFVKRPLFALIGLTVGFTVPTFAQQQDTTAPPESEQAKQIVALVEKAATLIDSKGKLIFPEFRKTGSEWRTGDTYLFDDLKGNVLFNAGSPKLEGTNSSSRKDSNGKLYWAEFAKVVQSKGSGWVDYMFPKTGESQSSQKWSYIKAVNIDGTPGFVATSLHGRHHGRSRTAARSCAGSFRPLYSRTLHIKAISHRR